MAWYKEWFDQEAYELVYQQRDEEEAVQVIDLVEQVAQPEPGAALLDVGCGRGRHARALARRGYDVTGIDLSVRALEEARRRADEEGLAITFERGDMREPAGMAVFDGALNLFTAFGYFTDDAEHERTICAIATALQRGGFFIQDFLNAPYVRATLVPEDERRVDGLRVEQRRWIEDGRINKTITLHHDGEVDTYRESVRLLTRDDFERFYATAGLELIDCFGDYDGSPHTDSSPRLILYARRR